MTNTCYDVLLDVSGDLPITCYVKNGPEVTQQKVKVRLGTALGEWFLDQYYGLPIHQWQSQKPFVPEVVSARIQSEIRKVTGVLAVTDWSFTWNIVTRAFSCTGSVLIEGASQAIPVVADIFPDGGNANPRIFFL